MTTIKSTSSIVTGHPSCKRDTRVPETSMADADEKVWTFARRVWPSRKLLFVLSNLEATGLPSVITKTRAADSA
jgi:hypothetical protein